MQRFIDRTFTEGQTNTIGVDFKIKTLQIDNKQVKIQVWDTAGQERFRSISRAYYRNANGCIAVYDVTDLSSFHATMDQVAQFLNYAPRSFACNIVLVGNKTDLAHTSREVHTAEVEQMARKLGLARVIETSAKEDNPAMNVDNALVNHEMNDEDHVFLIPVVNACDLTDGSKTFDSDGSVKSLNTLGADGEMMQQRDSISLQKNWNDKTQFAVGKSTKSNECC